MKHSTLLFTAILFFLPSFLKVLPFGKDLEWAVCFAQNVGISATGATPDNSAMLDVVSTSKGILIPRISLTSTTDAATIATPATSLLVYNTNAAVSLGAGYYYNVGTPASPLWVKFLNTGAGSAAADAWLTKGNSGTTANKFLGTTDNVSLRVRTNNMERMIVDSMGFIGIVTAYPQIKTEIANEGDPYNLYLSGFAPSIYLGNISGVHPNGGTGQTVAGFIGLATNNGDYGMSKGDMIFGTQSWQAGNSNAFRFVIPTDNLGNYSQPVPAMSILQSGNVGIGTANPESPLEISGRNYATYSNDRMAFYQPSDNVLAIQTLLDSVPRGTYGTYGGDYQNALELQPLVGGVGIGTTPAQNTKLAIKDGHLQSQQTTAPTISSTVTYVLASQSLSNATDMAGHISVTSTAAAGSVTVTFNKAYNVPPIVIITPTNAIAATKITLVYVTSTAAAFTINFSGSPTATTLTYNYHVIETQ